MSNFIRPWDVNQEAAGEEVKPKRGLFDNLGDAISAISANFDDIRGTGRLGNLRNELMNPELSDEEYNIKRGEYVQEYLNREAARQRYKEAHDNLVADDSFLKNIDQMGGTIEGMAAQGIGTAVGAGVGFLSPVVGGTALGAKYGNMAGAVAGGYLDARSVALLAEEDVLEAGGTWEQAKEAYDNALLKASFTTLPETAADIVIGNRLIRAGLGSGVARKIAGSSVGRAGSAILDPTKNIGTAMSRAFNPITGRLAGLATDVAVQGITEAGQEVTQDYIANREVAKALGQQDNEYSLEGFKDYALSDLGLETMKTAGIMGALFGGVGGALSSGQYLQHGAKTRQGNETYRAVKNLENDGKFAINADNREAEVKTLAEILRRDGVDENTIRSWSDAELAAASAEVRGKYISQITNEAQDQSIIRLGADTVNRFFSTDENRQLREGDVNNPMREYLHAVGVDDDAIARMFTTLGIEKSVVLNAKEQVEKQEGSEQTKAKLTQPTIDSMEQEQLQSGTERRTDGAIDDFTLEFGNGNNIGEKWKSVTLGDVQYVDTAIYRNKDTGRIVSVQKTQDGNVQVVDHGLSSNPENLFNLDNINSLPMKQYSSAKEAKLRLLENEDNKNDFRWMGKELGEEQTDTKDNDLDKTRVANDIDSFIKLRQLKPWLIDDKLLLEFSAIMQRAGMTKDAKIDYYFLLDQASEKGYGLRYTTDEGKAIVELYLGADIGTVVHELGHGAYWNLSQEDRNIFNKYAVKSCGEYIANIMGEDYDQDFVNRLQNYKKDKEFWNKMREHGAVYQTMFLLESFLVMSLRQTDQRGINRFMELRQQAIEERFAWEFSQWYVLGYAKGVQPSNAITRITQRGCFTVADKLNRIQLIWEYLHHRGGDYGDTPIESMYANAELGYTGNRYADLRDSSDLWLNETMNPPIVKPIKQEPVKLETTKQQKQTKLNKEEKQQKQTYTEEQKEQNKEDEKILNRKTVDVQGRYREQLKEKVSDIIGEFDQKSQNEVDKLVDIVKNKKSGWQKALQKLSNYSPSLYMDKLNGIQNSSNESTLDAYTKTYSNNNTEIKETPAPLVKENPTPTLNTKLNTKKNSQKVDLPTLNNLAKQNELFNLVEQKDPTLGKDGMAVYNKLKDKEKLSNKDKKEILGIINRIDALGKLHRYGALRTTLNNVLNCVKEEPTPKQTPQIVSPKPKTLGDSPAGRAVKLIKRLEKKKFLDTEEADYYANEFLGAAIDLKNWDKDFDGKLGLINQLNDIAEKIKSGEYFGEEIEEEESTQSNEEQTNDTKEKTQESAPVVENTQPTVLSLGLEQEETQETQSNNEPLTDNRAERIKEELIKNGIPRQQKNRLRAYLSNGDITQELHDAIYNELFPKQEETNKLKTSSSKMKHCIAYVKDKDGNYSTIKEDFRTQKEFKKSLIERGYEVIINTDNEDLFNERLAKYKDALEMLKERDRLKAEEQARREAEALAKAEAKAKADEEKARLAQEAAAKEAEKAQKEAEEKKAAEEAAAKEELEKKDAEEAKKKKLEEIIEKFKNQPLPDNIVDKVWGKTDEFFKYDPKIGEFVGYYKLVDDPERVNSVTGKPLKKMELSGIVDAKTYYKILDKWETLSYSDKEKMTTPIRGIPEFKLKSFATGHGYVRPKVQAEVKNETKAESKSIEETNNKNGTEPPTLTDKEIEKNKKDEQKRTDKNNKKKGDDAFKSLKKKFKNITGGEIGAKTVYKADEKQFIRIWIDRIDDAITSKKETLNNISNSLDEWKQNNINQKRTEVMYDYINNYIIEAGKLFPESVQKTDARSQSRAELNRKILEKAFLDTRFQWAWHGTRYRFNEFTLEHIGKGEGERASGWGLYFSKTIETAKAYYDLLKNDEITFTINGEEVIIKNADIKKGKYNQYFTKDDLLDILFAAYRIKNYEAKEVTKKDIILVLKNERQMCTKWIDELNASNIRDRETIGKINDLYKAIRHNNYLIGKLANVSLSMLKKDTESGSILLVNIPEDNELLHESKEFKDHSKNVQRGLLLAYKEARTEIINKINSYKYSQNRKNELISQVNDMLDIKNLKDYRGIQIYDTLADAYSYCFMDKRLGFDNSKYTKLASEKLNEKGIKGLTYLGTDSPARETSFKDGDCFVIFDDTAIDILNKFEKELGKWKLEKVDNAKNRELDKQKAQKKLQKRNIDSRYMAIGEIGIDSPLKNEEFMEKLETRWEHSYRIAGYKYGYTKEEINQSLEKYRGVEKEKVFDAIEDKLAKIYIDLNRAANMSIWKPQSKEIAPLDFQRGLDGKWRFYISDKDMKLKVSLKQLKAITNTGKQLKLKDIVKHDSLFKYYPLLGDINVEINDSKYDKTLKDNTYGYYEKQSNTIVFNNEFLNRKNNLEETLLHEVQHAIQHIEGFAIGGTEENIKNNPKQLDAFAQSVWNRKEEFRKYLEDNTRYNKGTIEHKVDEIFITPKVIRNRISSVLGNGIFMSNAERDFKKWITSDNKLFEEYASLLGEMEARDAEKRLNFKTEEEWRKNVPIISDKYYRNASYGLGRITSVTDSRSQSKKSKKKQEERERIQREIKEAKEKGEVTDTYKDVYSVSFDKEAQQNAENQKKIEYFEKKRLFWERHESNGLVTYTRKNPFEHHKKTIKYTGINGIESKEKEKSKLGKWYEWAKDQMIKYWFNDKQYLAKAARKLGVYDAYVRMMVTEGYEQRANVALTEGIMYNGKRTRALNDIIREVGYDKQRRFLDYCIAHRIKDLKNRDPEILLKMSVEEADEIIEDIKNSEYADLFENNRIDFVDYNKALLHVLVDGGIYSEEDFQKFCDNDPNFVPLAKVMDDADMGFNSIIHVHSLINAKKPIKKIGTSMREIKNPFLEMQKRTAEYYSIAARNRAGQIFVNEICGHLDRMFDDDVSIARGQGLIREVKVDELNGKLITRPDDKKQIIYVCDNGKHRFYQVADREIYLALKSLNDDQMNTLWRMIDNVAHKPAKWIRESATIVPDFGVRNLIRDNTEAFLTSEHGFFPFFDALWGMYQMANNTEWYQRYLDLVGEYGTLNRDNERTLATYSSTIDDKISYTKNLSEIYKQQMAIIKDTDKAYKEFINEKNSPQKKAMAAVKLFISPIWAGGKTLKRFNDYMEQGTRIGEFKNAKKNYNGFLDRMSKDAFKWDVKFDSLNDNSDIMAAGAAKEITLNFSQHGIWGKQLNRWIPFFNATLQGLYKFGNTMDLLIKGNDMSNLKNRRLQKELAFKVAMLAAFGIGTAAAGEGDEDYEEAPEYEKQNFWIFPNGIRIPKDQVLGTLVGTAFEQGYTQWRKGKTKPSEILNTIIEHFKPNSVIPAIVDIWGLGFIGNYDSFKKQQIVPEWLKNKRGFLQKDINTSYFASRVSEVLYKTIGVDISAKKIDYAIQKNFSNSAKYFNAVIDLAFSDNEKMARGYDKSDSTGEFVGGLRDKVPSPFNLVTGTFATNRTQFKSVDDFYKRYNELKVASSDEDSMTREEKREWKRYLDAYKKDTKLRKQLKAIKQNKSLSGALKREQADKIFKQQIKLAKWAEG